MLEDFTKDVTPGAPYTHDKPHKREALREAAGPLLKKKK